MPVAEAEKQVFPLFTAVCLESLDEPEMGQLKSRTSTHAHFIFLVWKESSNSPRILSSQKYEIPMNRF